MEEASAGKKKEKRSSSLTMHFHRTLSNRQVAALDEDTQVIVKYAYHCYRAGIALRWSHVDWVARGLWEAETDGCCEVHYWSGITYNYIPPSANLQTCPLKKGQAGTC